MHATARSSAGYGTVASIPAASPPSLAAARKCLNGKIKTIIHFDVLRASTPKYAKQGANAKQSSVAETTEALVLQAS